MNVTTGIGIFPNKNTTQGSDTSNHLKKERVEKNEEKKDKSEKITKLEKVDKVKDRGSITTNITLQDNKKEPITNTNTSNIVSNSSSTTTKVDSSSNIPALKRISNKQVINIKEILNTKK